MKFSKVMCTSLSLAAALSSLAGVAQADTTLRAGDRVVFYGDSITQQRLYTRYIQQYIDCRYPGLKIHFYNAGWSGDTAVGALARLDRDVLVLKPTVATLFFGMNDGGYTEVTDAIKDRYLQNLEGIITRLQDKGVRVIVFTPGCVDPDRQTRLGDVHYNDNLAALSQVAIDLAKKHGCVYVDVHDPMLAYQTAHKQKDPKFFMIPDGVHPDPSGHLVMTSIMLTGFGVDPLPPLGEIDIANGNGKGLRVAGKADGVVKLEQTQSSGVPFWFDSGSATAMTDSGFDKMAEQRLMVRGLTSGSYDVAIDGREAGEFTADDLAAGALIPGTYSDAGQKVHDLTSKKEDLYYTTWRDMRLPLGDTPGVSKVVSDLMSADNDFTSAISGIADASSKSVITLTPLPGGVDLALNKTYVASDPNMYNWGIGGLTDGSWEASSQHCFASGDKDAFPKTATIDLGQAASVSTVQVGVPGFGATKTIEVSVSTDGANFTSVGTHTFDEAKEARFVYKFAPVDARYVRLSYPDHYADGHGYSNTFVFTTECKVYGESH